ncbi:nucleoside-diphosphate sugar epimerase/dehydratase [Candidatus Korobacter versatilis]|nr:nucleoside-diphosphate sugar epimerase/dehydratase [Candidatus Koribacter versatilis]
MKQRAWAVGLFQIVLVVCSLFAAWALRFDFRLPHLEYVLQALPILIVLRLAAFARFNLFHGYWRYTGVNDALDIAKAVSTSSIVFAIVIRYLLGNSHFPISVYLLEAALSLLLLCGVRVASRAMMESAMREAQSTGKGVVIVGAGFAGQLLVRELQRPESGFRPVAFVDDDPRKQGVKIQGLPIAGTVEELSRVLREFGATEVLIAIPSANAAEMRRIVQICSNARVGFKTIPSLGELASGNVGVTELRSVNLEDLLGREPVKQDLEAVRDVLSGAVVMVTGAAGSIGSELCRQIQGYGPSLLICVDQNETGLFNLQQELLDFPNPHAAAFFVADVGDAPRMRHLFQRYRVDYVFHAAAYKHVPLMEDNPREAIQNNVVALRDLMRIADKAGCKRFLLISSDKAVNPSSLMGCTKRVGELLLGSWPTTGMDCVSVRFGNVLGSQGSVIPLFQQQITRHRRITVTHKDITRFFMTIPEAVALVLQGFTVGSHGDILVLDMGEAIRIVDMAKALIRLSGKSEEDVEIVFTGLRPGEKLYEELFYAHESVEPTDVPKVQKTRGQMIATEKLAHMIDELEGLIQTEREDAVRAKMKQIVPQYMYAPVREYAKPPVRAFEVMRGKDMSSHKAASAD